MSSDIKQVILEQINTITSNNPEEVHKEAFRILSKLLQNISKDPGNEKVRFIKKSNETIKNKVLVCKGLQELLLALGFEDSDDSFAFKKEELSLIEIGVELIDGAPNEVQQPVQDPVQDPVQEPTQEKDSLVYQIKQKTSDFDFEWSGSSYEGPMKDGWFHGFGEFSFPSGVVYEGEFYKGEFHGKGTLIFPSGGKYIATWNRGRAMEGEYEYYDGLKYNQDTWTYCQIPDRRFYTEIVKGLRPSGATLEVNNPAGPKQIPPGTYDVGEGYFDLKTKTIYSFEGTEIRKPEEEEIEVITTKYRYNPGVAQNLTEEAELLSA